MFSKITDTIKEASDTIINTTTDCSNSVIDGVCEATTYTKDTAVSAIDSISTTTNNVIDITKDTTVSAFNSATEITIEAKEQVFDYLTENKNYVVSKIEERFDEEIHSVFEDILIDTILSFIHGLIPFPLNILIPEPLFVAFGRSSSTQIKKILL